MSDFIPDYRDPHEGFPPDYNDRPEEERAAIMEERFRLLHVYGSFSWHSEVRIVGNRNGLIVLRDAINGAITSGHDETTATVSDGEGFGVKVRLNDEKWEHPSWNAEPLPYSDPIACGQPDPEWMISRMRYALKQANAQLVKRGVRPIDDPSAFDNPT